MKLDLHTHSSASDGQYTPAELVKLANGKSLEIFAITDHDSVSGLEEGRQEAEKLNMRFIPGIEISAQEDEEIHVLGYGIDYQNELILKCCEDFRNDRLHRGDRICGFLKSKGVDIDMASILEIAGDSNLGRPHFARYLIDKGYVSERKEAFDKYLDTPEFLEATRRKEPTIPQSIDIIHSAGGKAVLAHPAFIHKTEDELEDMVARLKEYGLDGIECFYSKHKKPQTDFYLELAYKYKLKTSCGSDFHGENVKADVALGMDLDMETYGDIFIL